MITKLKESMILSYQRYGDDKVIYAKQRLWTGNELAKEIESESDFGLELVEMLVALTIDLLARNKIKSKI